jgi:hypothetical protein
LGLPVAAGSVLDPPADLPIESEAESSKHEQFLIPPGIATLVSGATGDF